jgi:hypothetical protein
MLRVVDMFLSLRLVGLNKVLVNRKEEQRDSVVPGGPFSRFKYGALPSSAIWR